MVWLCIAANNTASEPLAWEDVPKWRLRPGRTLPAQQDDSGVPSSELVSTSRRVQTLASSTLALGSRRTTVFRRSSSRVSADPALGLLVLYQPDPSVAVSADIIFVHGLGGHRQKTWSKNHDPDLFWPKLWLPLEPGMDATRILTFGYNANWHDAARTTAGVQDFAKELLFEMSFATDAAGEPLRLGTRPIVFVVHSMGGLVVKKLLLLGLQDEAYRGVVEAVSSILFLSTPHRGTHLAETLNRILAASLQTSKKYISDLGKNSSMIEEINEGFRHIAPRLAIWSFYETLATTIGPKKILVLEKDSAVLGYPKEISKPLNADHHDVCKYSGPTDSNYLGVRNAIKALVSAPAVQSTTKLKLLGGPADMVDVQALFQDCPSSESDFNMIWRQLVPATCAWFLKVPEIESWLQPSSGSRIVWYCAPPGSGKSNLAAHMISHLKAQSKTGLLHCQFFLFKFSDAAKQSVDNCLRSLASQLVRDLPEFQRALATASPQSLGLNSSDPFLLWQNIFEKYAFPLADSAPIYWVIDALDECESPANLIALLQSLSLSRLPINVLLLSRQMDNIPSLVGRLSDAQIPLTQLDETCRPQDRHDIRLLVQHHFKHMRGSAAFKQDLLDQIVQRSEGSMLWAKLALDEVQGCHVESDVQRVLEEVPNDMTLLYRRMERNLISSTRRFNVPLIRALLTWAMCAHQALRLGELAQALQPEFSGFLDLKNTIQDACGQFIQVDDDTETVMIFHHTAREYFMRTRESEFYIEPQRAHQKLLEKTLQVLQDPGLRWQLKQHGHALQKKEPFVFYAAVSWYYHFEQCCLNVPDMGSIDLLLQFLHSAQVLSWIHTLALEKRLEVLIRVSKALSVFTADLENHDKSTRAMSHRIPDLEYLESWVTDLLKLVGKFGPNIVAQPEILYDTIPALCPPQSVLHRQFYDPRHSRIRLPRHHLSGWTDLLGRFIPRDGRQAWKMCCAGKTVSLLATSGEVGISDAVSFGDVCTIIPGEIAVACTLNDSGSRLATYGLSTTKIWAIPSGQLLLAVQNPPRVKALALAFGENSRRLIAVGDDNVVRHVKLDDLDAQNQGWQVPFPDMLHQTRHLPGAMAGSPSYVAFNGDKTQIGVAYRGAPLSIWNIVDGQLIGRKKRSETFRGANYKTARHTSDAVGLVNWVPAKRFAWNPRTGHVLGIYKDSSVFKWHPVTDDNEDSRIVADEIATSPNGLFFVTSSSSNDSICVWNHSRFTVIYRLSTEDLVNELVFSPDSRRFYVLSNRWANAWEPLCLARGEERARDSNIGSKEVAVGTGAGNSEEALEVKVVTALSPSPDGQSYCVGFDDGRCLYFADGQTDGVVCATFYTFLDVFHIAWSPDSQFVAAADTAGSVKVNLLRCQSGQKSPEIVEQANLHIPLNHHNISQMIFRADSKHLFVTTGARAFVCSVEDGTFTAQLDLQHEQQRTWIRHPTKDRLMSFSTSGVKVYDWDELKLSGPAQNESASTTGVDTVLLTQDEKHAVLLSGQKMLAFPGPASATPSGKDTPLTPKFPSDYVKVPGILAALIKVPLGILPSKQIVFLDHSLWLCAYPLHALKYGYAENWLRRFYFIPRDWVNTNSLSLCSISDDGTLFWPRDGYVEVVECDLINEPKIA